MSNILLKVRGWPRCSGLTVYETIDCNFMYGKSILKIKIDKTQNCSNDKAQNRSTRFKTVAD